MQNDTRGATYFHIPALETEKERLELAHEQTLLPY